MTFLTSRVDKLGLKVEPRRHGDDDNGDRDGDRVTYSFLLGRRSFNINNINQIHEKRRHGDDDDDGDRDRDGDDDDGDRDRDRDGDIVGFFTVY